MGNAEGSEQQGRRPVLVVQANDLNSIDGFLTYVTVPLTSAITNRKRDYPNNVFIRKGEGGTAKDSLILCHQVRAMDESQFIRKLGDVTEDTMMEVEQSLAWVLGML